MPVMIMGFAVIFNAINAGFNGYWFAFISKGYASSWLTDPRFIIGILLFVCGFYINQYHDRILLKLRRNSRNGYKIPFGGLFKYVSCPNFLGEIIEWSGFVLVAWNLPALSFLIWTLSNLIPRAISHHKWYKSEFADYPKKRKAILPKIL
jgi:steroid 5-alpha reductase family enzyme